MTDLKRLINTLEEFNIDFTVGKFYNKDDVAQSLWLSIGGVENDQYVEFDLKEQLIY